MVIFSFLYVVLKLRKEFSGDVESAMTALRGLPTTSSCGHADLTSLFRVASHEAKKSRAQNRILRVVSNKPHFYYTFSSVAKILTCLDYSFLNKVVIVKADILSSRF